MTSPAPDQPYPARWDHIPFYRWWRKSVVGSVDQEKVVARIVEESGCTPRYLFMTMMSAGIAVVGLKETAMMCRW